jgi:hypothetical protein
LNQHCPAVKGSATVGVAPFYPELSGNQCFPNLAEAAEASRHNL